MHQQELTKVSEFSTQLAIGSFAIGTFLLMILAVGFDHEFLFIVGLLYVLLALVINGLVFIYLFFEFLLTPSLRRYLAVKMLLMLANIPIAFFYIFLIANNFFNL